MVRLASRTLWLFAAIVAGRGVAAAATIDVDTVLGPDHPYQDQTITVIDGANPPTNITILEGAGIGDRPGEPIVTVGLDLYGSSRAHMLGGGISGFPHNVLLHDESVFRMDAGSLDTSRIEARDDSTVILNGGAWRAVDAYGSSRIYVNGGEANSTFDIQTFGQSHAVLNSARLIFTADESSTAVINGGSYEGLLARGSSELLVNGGRFITGMQVTDNAIVRMRDFLDMNEENVEVSNNAVVHVYGTNLRFETDDEDHTLVFGNWYDGDVFAFRYRLFDQGQIILHEVPEPGSLALLTVGAAGLLVLRRAHFVSPRR